MPRITKPEFQSSFYRKLKDKAHTDLHIVVIGTKPDIIKQAPLVLELKKRDKLILLGHTGQHYDAQLNEDAQKVFGISPDFNINARGAMDEKMGQMVSRFGAVITELAHSGKNIIPYVHGDTTTAVATAIAAFINTVAPAHVEAGLRSYNVNEQIISRAVRTLKFDRYYAQLQDQRNWHKGSLEPYPEQFDTRTIGTTAGIHFAPTSVNAENLIAEGYRKDRIAVVGNSVADAIKIAMGKKSAVMQRYPALQKGFVRFTVHRRENVASYHRFVTIFETMEDLVKNGTTVLWLAHNANKDAMARFNLQKKLDKLIARYPNLIYSDTLWDYDDNIVALSNASVNVTDSGSEQEETNILHVPSVTVRFGSDRPETAWAGCNIIAPPISVVFLSMAIQGAYNNKNLRIAPNLYGTNVSRKIADLVDRVLTKDGSLWQWSHEQYGFDKQDYWRKRP